MQSYIIYGNEGDIPLWDWQAPFVTVDKDFDNKERIQEFFDDYDIREYGNYWGGRYNVTFPQILRGVLFLKYFFFLNELLSPFLLVKKL